MPGRAVAARALGAHDAAAAFGTVPHVSDTLDLVQWPAMAVTVGSTWLVASSNPARRQVGFWLFLFSNVLWVVWGWHSGAPALVALQLVLAVMNIRGARKAEEVQ